MMTRKANRILTVIFVVVSAVALTAVAVYFASFFNNGGDSEIASVKYTVSYVTNCETQLPSDTVSLESPKLRDPDPEGKFAASNPGYGFHGWYTNSDFRGSRIDFGVSGYTVSSDITLYAKWLADT